MAKKPPIYGQIIEHIFKSKFKPGDTEIPFLRTEIPKAAKSLGIKLPKNLGDVVYAIRYRTDMPKLVAKTAPKGKVWVIFPNGKGKYKFVPRKWDFQIPRKNLSVIKVPNATPAIIDMYALDDEQALLARIRYSRLIDIFTSLNCYALQSHLRTSVKGMGQVETDEVYVGLDRAGAHWVIPMQAKGRKDKIGIVQIEQDFGIVEEKFPELLPLPMAAQTIEDDVIAMFAYEKKGGNVTLLAEKHFDLVPPEDLSSEELAHYRSQSSLMGSKNWP